MARTDNSWIERASSYIQTAYLGGRDVLINGFDRYLNFNAVSGASGYGFRDNDGVMQWKNEGGSWADFGSGGGASAEEFETVSKNLKSYPYALAYTGNLLTTITYDLGSGLEIVKTFGYTGEQLTTITLSADTPSGIALTKTLDYTGKLLTGVSYA